MKLRFQVEASDGPALIAAAQAHPQALVGELGLDAKLTEVNIVRWVRDVETGQIKAWCAECEAWVEGLL